MRSVIGAAILVAAMLIRCSFGQGYTDATREPTAIPVPADAYHDLAWLGPDLIATALTSQDSGVLVLAQADGTVVRRVDVRVGGHCARTFARGLVGLPTGELGLVAMCVEAAGESSTLLGYGFSSGSFTDLGTTVEPAVVATWDATMERTIYVVDGSLCATLYERRAGYDGPLQRSIQVAGRSVPLGEDLAAADDRCTHEGNADWPAYSPDGSMLAVMVAPVTNPPSQARLDQAWSLALVDGDGARAVLNDVRYPRGLGWLSDARVVLAAQVFGQDGLWVVDIEATTVTKIGDIALAWIAVTDGRVAALIEQAPAGPVAPNSLMVVYDLADVR